jgi:hypothetical protein
MPAKCQEINEPGRVFDWFEGLEVYDDVAEFKGEPFMSWRAFQDSQRATQAELAQSGIACPDNGFSPISDLEFVEDIGDVVADGFLADCQPFGYRRIIFTLSDEVEHLPFASR